MREREPCLRMPSEFMAETRFKLEMLCFVAMVPTKFSSTFSLKFRIAKRLETFCFYFIQSFLFSVSLAIFYTYFSRGDWSIDQWAGMHARQVAHQDVRPTCTLKAFLRQPNFSWARKMNSKLPAQFLYWRSPLPCAKVCFSVSAPNDWHDHTFSISACAAH